MAVILAFVVAGIFLIGAAFSCGKQGPAEPPPKKNSPPVVTSVQILPEKPAVKNYLSLLVQCQDPDGDPITYEYQWLRNDEKISGENKNVLMIAGFRKGDFFRVRVVAGDGKEKGEPFLSPAVRVVNSPPEIQEVRVEPSVVHAQDHPKVSVKGEDKDGDSIYYTYQWEINGDPVPEERGEKLERASLKNGDRITVLVTPDDRETLGTPKKSDPVRVVNSPPVIISSPTTSPEGNIYLYQVQVNDPDQDPIAFTLQQGARGMTIDAKTGLLRWEIRPEDKGAHTLVIEASDNEGAKSIQRYSLSVDFK
jgi:hypothetical protein